jgi:hypothetical protein
LASLGALAAGSLFIAAGSAHASDPPIDATNYTVKCTTLTKGTVGFAPPLHLGGALPNTTKVKGTLSGCTATPAPGGDPVTVISGSVSGLINGTNDCAALLGPSTATGTITIKWKTVQKLSNAATVVTIGSGDVSGGLANPFADAATYGKFSISGTSQTGPFSGPSGNGAASSTQSLTVQDVGVLGAQCNDPIKGLKGVNLGPTEISLG